MVVTLTLLVRNEIDIVQQHIEYHLSLGIDHIIVTNNLSNDGTEGYLESLKDHKKITIFNEVSDDYNQSVWVTKMAHYAQETLSSDWIIHSDCDEFFIPYANFDLKEVLQNISRSVSYLNVNRYDFVPYTENPIEPILGMKHKKLVSTNIFGNKLPPKIIHRNIPKLIVSQGNHSIDYPSNLLGIDCHEIDIFHYPVRSYFQFESKILLGGNAYLNNKQLNANVGSTWRYLFQMYQEGRLQEIYDKMCYSKERLNLELESGEIVLDESLSKRLGNQQSLINRFLFYLKGEWFP